MKPWPAKGSALASQQWRTVSNGFVGLVHSALSLKPSPA